MDIVNRLLTAIQTEFSWPNASFLPNDPLFLAIISEFEHDLSVSWFSFRIRKEFNVDMSVGEFQPMYDADWTLGQFLQYLERRTDK